ncbi:sugar phosphate isomerase/epimerase family protein [Agromyces protaetiae]|uniref:sugar phosphate isomerase/epimerase family protein n=1 Tax=Agromyces protaetiae TaxID=2509455 RepID=UPI0013ED96A3|nr:sugar phosphate isomerase/epimerase [Agromyces protaetiae]
MVHHSVSLQLYSVRDALEADPVGTIDRVAALGFTAVESGFKALTAHPELVDAIHRNDLATPTMTSPLFRVADREAVWALAKRLGAHTVVETFIPEEHWTSVEDVDAIAAELNASAAEAAAHGLRVGYHNHWWELETRFDGVQAMELLIDRLVPEVILEIDAYWVAVGGEDAVAFVGRHADRIRYLHLKDGPIDRENTHQRPAGTGSMPIRELIAAATSLEGVVVEFDAYDGDVFAASEQSRLYLTGIVGGSVETGSVETGAVETGTVETGANA